MSLSKSQNEKLIKVLDRYTNFQFIDNLVKDFKIEKTYAINIINSAGVADLYIDVKGSTESRILGFENKESLLKAILFLSKEKNWVAFNNIDNSRSFMRKIKSYKIEREKSIYEGLSSFISKSLNKTNARKISNEQLEGLKKLQKENPKMSKPKIHKKLIENFKDLKTGEGTTTYYLRKSEIESFKKKID